MIPFNKPFLTGKELHYVENAVKSGKISGNGIYTKNCQDFFEKNYGIRKALLTTSCTDALEMCAILANITHGDEVIVPSFTFVSTALAFVRQGAVIRFTDSRFDHPGMDVYNLESLINEKTKAIVPVHYAGVACDMDAIIKIADIYNLIVIEDAAHSIDSYFLGRPLGSIGHMAAFSFHETKNINAGEGGLLAINDDRFTKRAEIVWEKGTNRNAFFRGEVDKYGWIDLGSSFLPSELTAAFLYAQIENLNSIQLKRREIWTSYHEQLHALSLQYGFKIPYIPSYATNNGHMFYLICRSKSERTELLNFLKLNGILAVFHYQSLHKSLYYKDKYSGPELPYTDYYSEHLVRLPFFFNLTNDQISKVVEMIESFYSRY